MTGNIMQDQERTREQPESDSLLCTAIESSYFRFFASVDRTRAREKLSWKTLNGESYTRGLLRFTCPRRFGR